MDIDCQKNKDNLNIDTLSEDNFKIYQEKNLVYYTEGEEKANTISHFFGMLFGFCGFSLLFFTKDIYGRAAVIIMCIALTVPYLVSAIYHGVKDLDKKAFWRKIDHSDICFIILGCGAPLCLCLKRNVFDYTALAVSIAICITNVILCYSDFKKFINILLAFDYICAFLLTAAYFVNRSMIPPVSRLFYIIGSVFVITGAVFYSMKKLYTHTVFHILMVFGTVSYYFAAMLYII